MARSDHVEAGQRFLARLVTVVTVMAGLVVLIVPLCGDGMSMMPPTAVSAAADPIDTAQDAGPVAATSGSCAPVVVDPAGAPCGPVTASLLPSLPGAEVPGGALLACLAFVIAVLAVVLGLRPGWAPRVAVVRRVRESRRLIGRLGWGPTLAELCVLRT